MLKVDDEQRLSETCRGGVVWLGEDVEEGEEGGAALLLVSGELEGGHGGDGGR